MSKRSLPKRVLGVALSIMFVDCIYLTWRFVALREGWVEPHTGLCSWSEQIDCDKILMTPEARAFYLPNAVLGLGFYGGMWLWWFVGQRLGVALRHRLQVLLITLGMASIFTLWFWYLLLGLPFLCPFCPWNHIMTYIALGSAVYVYKKAPGATSTWTPIGKKMVLFCMVQGVVIWLIWLVFYWMGYQPDF